MASLLSNLFDNLAEGVHEIKCKNGHDKKKSEECGKNTKHSAHANDDKLCMWMVESMHLTDLSLIYAKLSIF